MPTINYDKWNKLDDYSSDEEVFNQKKMDQQQKTSRFHHSSPKCTLVTIPWDSHCEQIRWALDLHQFQYIEKSYPWGLHLLGTLPYSDENYPKTTKNSDETQADSTTLDESPAEKGTKTVSDEKDPSPKTSTDQPKSIASPPSPPHINVPILENSKKEVFKKSTTYILMYMFANSFSGRIRIYSQPKTLDLQEQFDDEFASACKILFVNTILKKKELSLKYFCDTIHLNTHKAIYTWIFKYGFFLAKFIMMKSFGIDSKSIEKSNVIVDKVFDQVETILNGNAISHLDECMNESKKSKYLSGTCFQAADLSFASHAALVLYPNTKDDMFANNLGLTLPYISELPTQEDQDRVKQLRSTTAGKFAFRMYRKERGVRTGTFESKFSKQNNPWWTNAEEVSQFIANVSFGVCIIGAGILTLLPFWIGGLCFILSPPLFLFFWNKDYLMKAENRNFLIQRLKQIKIILFDKIPSAKSTNDVNNNVEK